MFNFFFNFKKYDPVIYHCLNIDYEILLYCDDYIKQIKNGIKICCSRIIIQYIIL